MQRGVKEANVSTRLIWMGGGGGPGGVTAMWKGRWLHRKRGEKGAHKSSWRAEDGNKMVGLHFCLGSAGTAAAHWFSKSLSTAPALASAETGTGVKVGSDSEMGFISRWPPELGGATRGTAWERGARKGLASPARFPAAAAPAGRGGKTSRQAHIP